MSHDHRDCCCPWHPEPEVPDFGWLWLLLLVAGLLLVGIRLDLLDSVRSGVIALLCAVPAGWLIREGIAEWRIRRMFDRPEPLPTPRRAEPPSPPALRRKPIAIEAARPVVPLFIIDGEVER